MCEYKNFPSGRTVNRCRQEAKALVKESKLSGTPIKYSYALRIIAKKHGIDAPWEKVLEMLRKRNGG